MNDLKVCWWPISRPRPYPRNARKWSPAAVQKVAHSIEEYGWTQPIVVDKNDVIIIGHLRLEAAKSLALREVPVYVADRLTPAQVRGLRLMDNRSHQEAEWDLGLLGPELEELRGLDFDLELTGFDDCEIYDLLADPDLDDRANLVPAVAALPGGILRGFDLRSALAPEDAHEPPDRVLLPAGGLDDLGQRHTLGSLHHRDYFGLLVGALFVGASARRFASGGLLWGLLSFCRRDLPAATFDSCCNSHPVGFDRFECSAVRFERGLLAREVHEALTNHVAILRVQLNEPRLPSRLLARDQRRTRPAEDIEYRVARLAAVANRALNQLHWLHGRVLHVYRVVLFAGASPAFCFAVRFTSELGQPNTLDRRA
jgi:hypothetical protein